MQGNLFQCRIFQKAVCSFCLSNCRFAMIRSQKSFCTFHALARKYALPNRIFPPAGRSNNRCRKSPALACIHLMWLRTPAMARNAHQRGTCFADMCNNACSRCMFAGCHCSRHLPCTFQASLCISCLSYCKTASLCTGCLCCMMPSFQCSRT